MHGKDDLKARDHLEDLVVDMSIILKWIDKHSVGADGLDSYDSG
jgi:hypothetical protein